MSKAVYQVSILVGTLYLHYVAFFTIAPLR